MTTLCQICKHKTKSFFVITRDKSKRKINFCNKCDFQFFNKNLSKSLSENKLDISRYNFEGLKMIPKTLEFKNGIEQSKEYIKQYINEIPKNNKILEIGCSWGYFLHLVNKKKLTPYGVEVSVVKSNFVNKKLKICCEKNLDKIIKKEIKFKKIFLFYVVEYIENPLKYISKLLTILDKKGEIIIITPNINDPLKTIWKNESFKIFFYEKHAINYFSKKTLKKICDNLNIKKYDLFTKQGYSFLNHINWNLNNKPLPSSIVCGDLLVNKIGKILFTRLKKLNYKKTIQIINYLKNINNNYSKIFEKKDLGNQIHLIIKN